MRRRFSGRDPHERHRAATPLELLYDLTIVVAFGTASDEMAHYVAEGHVGAGIGGFAFAVFAVSWAWIAFSWFASAYDTDDWVFRLATAVQMAGVIIITLGLSPMFASIDHGDVLDNDVMVAGYVVMRIGIVFLWLQVARHDPERRPAARSYAASIAAVQAGWIALAILDLPIATTFGLAGVLYVAELSGPFVAEHLRPTPWHAHHIAERYGLLVIITLGEVIIGTVAAMNALVHGPAGWSVDAVLLLVTGVGLVFGCWWSYFVLPWAEPLERHRERGFAYGYGHLLLFGALAAMGAGLHVASYGIQGEAHVGQLAIVLTVAVPLALFVAVLYGLYCAMVRTLDPFHLILLAGSSALLAAGVVLAAAGVDTAVCLLVLALTPVVTVVGYETLGHRHVDAALDRL